LWEFQEPRNETYFKNTKMQILRLLSLVLLVLNCASISAQSKVNYSDKLVLLKSKLSKRVQKCIVRNNDTNNIYVGDDDRRDLYYQIIMPKHSVRGTVVLLPGTWETTEHVWNSTSELVKQSVNQNLAVVVLSINQRLTMTDEIVELINIMCEDAILKFQLPISNFVFGGFSMGGIFSLRYTEMSKAEPTKARIYPKAVFSCDGPCDLKHIYANFQRKKDKNPGLNEPKYGIAELEYYCEGNPSSNPSKYEYYSPFTFDSIDGGNAKYLLIIPVRIYADVDPVWWMQNRHVDMYDLNALDQTAMIQLLNDKGNQKAEFINAYQRGVRIEGNRHPHSWSIVDPRSTVVWILSNLN
jgi:hypothetical protein